jgi:uncharacterized membrane protein
LAWWLIARADASMTRDHALGQDQSGYVIFLFVVGAACASIVAIGFVVSTIKELAFWSRAWHLTLTIDALISSWLLIQTVFAFHYARRYYAIVRRQRTTPAELLFPGGREPDYLDFAYYSFVVGMTSQVSDVAVTSRQMRQLTLIHGALAFVFNIAVLALSINIIASDLDAGTSAPSRYGSFRRPPEVDLLARRADRDCPALHVAAIVRVHLVIAGGAFEQQRSLRQGVEHHVNWRHRRR